MNVDSKLVELIEHAIKHNRSVSAEISLGSYNTIMNIVHHQVSPNAVVICGASKITSLANNF